jgi:glycosyltransferase involved in cell wall biosynthesis
MTSAAKLLVLYRATAAPSAASNIGLGVSALHTVRVLRRAGVAVEAARVAEVVDVDAQLRAHPEATHCLIEAPWIGRDAMAEILHAFPRVHFIVRSHSQIGFLQVEPGAISLLRELLVLSENVLNLTVATNSRSLKRFFEIAYHGHALYLPNLYDFERVRRKRDAEHRDRILRVGSFGALRLLKNHTTAAAAALMLARKRNVDLELWVSVDTDTMGGAAVLDSLRRMFAGLPWAKLVEAPWHDWASFRRTAATMDLCIAPSMTETFNVTVADAVAEGVPCVVSPAIEWAPDAWKAETDRIEDIVRTGSALLSGCDADEGLERLERFVGEAIERWVDYLTGPPARLVAAA